MKAKWLLLAFLILLPSSADAVWFNGSWDYRVKVEVNRTKVGSSTAVTNFPVYLDLAGMPASFWTLASSTGADIRVVESDEITETPFELVSIATTTKRGELHFLADTLATTSTSTFYVYYGNPAAAAYAVTDPFGRNAVWSPSSYQAVYHMHGLTDSTSNGNNLTNNSAVTFGSTNAQVGSSTSIYNGTNANYLYRDSSFGRAYNGAFSLSFTVYPDSDPIVDYDIAEITFAGNPGQRMRILYEYNGGARRIRMYQNTTVGTTFFDINGNIGATQGKYDIVFTGTTISLYKNGIAAFSAVSNNANAGSVPTYTRLSLGNTPASAYGAALVGKIDETRLTTAQLSASTLLTEYNNQSSTSTFLFIGAQEGDPADVSPRSEIIWFD